MSIALMHLKDRTVERHLRAARFADNPWPCRRIYAGAFDAFLEPGLDAAAGVRQALARFAQATTGVRVLSDNFTEIRQAMSVPKGRAIAVEYVQNFINRSLLNGLVAKGLDESDERDARVAKPTVSEL